MFENLLLVDILKNPLILGAIFAIVRNIGGYATACWTAKKLLPYSGYQLLETFSLFETFFVLLMGVASLPSESAATIAVIVDILRSLKKTIADTAAKK
jgi:hypothetical protein